IGKDGPHLAARTARNSLDVRYENRYVNVLDDAVLIVSIFNQRVVLPGKNERYSLFNEPPSPKQTQRFTPERVYGQDWCWKSAKGIRTSAEISKEAVHLFLDQLKRKT